MSTTALIVTIISYVLPLVAGYLLRHWGISVPGLPAPTPVSTPANGVDHAGLLQQVLEVGKEEAQALLKTAVQDVIAKGLADLKQAANQPQAPKA